MGFSRWEGGGSESIFSKENSSPLEFQKNEEFYEQTDPFQQWDKAEGIIKIGDLDVDDIEASEEKLTSHADISEEYYNAVAKLRNKLLKLVTDKNAAFQKEGKYTTVLDNTQHKIELKPGNNLKRSPGPRKRSAEDQQFIKEQIEKLLEQGLIRVAPDATVFASPIHIVKKPGKAKRFTIDYRILNEMTKPDSFPLPRMDEILYSFDKSNIFSTLDAVKGFWQIPMDPESQEYTAFKADGLVYLWNVMPMGLTNSPATFQRFMNKHFADMPFVKIYIDDIIIASSSPEEHLKQIELVLDRCIQKGITLNRSKCNFMKSTIKILGYYISKKGITQDPEKLAAIRDYGIPKNKKQLRSFLHGVGAVL